MDNAWFLKSKQSITRKFIMVTLINCKYVALLRLLKLTVSLRHLVKISKIYESLKKVHSKQQTNKIRSFYGTFLTI